MSQAGDSARGHLVEVRARAAPATTAPHRKDVLDDVSTAGCQAGEQHCSGKEQGPQLPPGPHLTCARGAPRSSPAVLENFLDVSESSRSRGMAECASISSRPWP